MYLWQPNVTGETNVQRTDGHIHVLAGEKLIRKCNEKVTEVVEM